MRYDHTDTQNCVDGPAADAFGCRRRFWDGDLVYTSSAGTRTNKTEILQGFAEQDGNSADAPAYHAEDVDIRLYGDTAVVAFRLVAVAAKEPGGAAEQHYLNTGTFIRREDGWRAVAWQATRIPDPE
jgi:ketosteroid isomerase-like protein